MSDINIFLEVCAENKQKCTLESMQIFARQWTDEPFNLKFFNNVAWLLAYQRNFPSFKYFFKVVLPLKVGPLFLKF